MKTKMIALLCVFALCSVTGCVDPDDLFMATNNVPMGVPVVESDTLHKVSASGSVLPYTANDWHCVLDADTGLVWEVKSINRQHYNRGQFRYTWYAHADASGNPGVTGAYQDFCAYQQDATALCNTEDFVKYMNKQKRCGYDDWRVPSVDELGTIIADDTYHRFQYINGVAVIGGLPAVRLNSSYFPNSAYVYWTNESYPYDNTKAYAVSNTTGDVVVRSKSDSMSLMLVRTHSL